MTGVYFCNNCKKFFFGGDLKYCPFCGQELKFKGVWVGVNENIKRKTIVYWSVEKEC